VFGVVAEFERDLILERTMAGLEAAKARGRHGGRPRALDEGQAKLARRLKDEGEHSVEEICSMLGGGEVYAVQVPGRAQRRPDATMAIDGMATGV
jgi:DNA invertase Pin-like site-specific DNA recombinase